jgi:putative membrane protein
MRSVASLCAACLLAGGAWAQQDAPVTPPGAPSRDDPVVKPSAIDLNAAAKENPEAVQPERSAPVDVTPQLILEKLHLANLEEIEAGRLAEQSGTDRVKDYARTLQRDHRAADEKVKALAKKKGLAFADKPAPSQKHQAEKDMLAGLTGADFDRAFTGMMAQGHRQLIAAAQRWRSPCKDEDVCALLDQMMPRLREHEQMAEKLHGPLPQGRAP